MALEIQFRVDDKASPEIKALQKQLKLLKPSINDTDVGFLKMNKSLLALGATYISFQAIKAVTTSFIRQADAMTLVNTKLQLATNSTEELAIAQAELFEISQRTRVGFSGSIELFERLSRSTRDYNIEQKELLDLTETINKSMVISGGTAQSMNAAIVQLGQAFSADFQSVGQELASIREQAPRLYQAFLEGTGKTSKAFKKMAEDGELSTKIILEALKTQGIAVNEEFGKVNLTVDQAMINISNSMLGLIGHFDKIAGATGSLSEAMQDFSKLMDDNQDAIVDFGLITFAVLDRTIDGFNLLQETAEFGIESLITVPQIGLQKFIVIINEQIADLKMLINDIAGFAGQDDIFSSADISNNLLQANLALDKSSQLMKGLKNEAKEVTDAFIAWNEVPEERVARWKAEVEEIKKVSKETKDLTKDFSEFEEDLKGFDTLEDFLFGSGDKIKSFNETFGKNLESEIKSAFSNVRDFDDFAEAFGSAVSSALANSVSASLGEAMGGGIAGALGGGIVGAGVGIVFNELFNRQDEAAEAKRIRDEKLQASVDGLKDATERLYAQVFGAGTGIQQTLTKDMTKTLAEFSEVQKKLAEAERITGGSEVGEAVFGVAELQTEFNNLAIEIKEYTSELVSSIDAIAEFSDRFGDLSDKLSGTTIQADIRGENALAETYALLGISSEAEFQAKLDELVTITEFRNAEAIKEGLTADVDSQEYQDALDAVSGLSTSVIDAINNYDTLATAVDFLNKTEEERISVLSESQKAVNNAMLGSLSYLSDLEKLSFANNIFQSAVTPEDRISSSRTIAEISRGTTRTKEEFIPAFSQFINELEKQADEATTLDVVNKLDEVVVAIEASADSATEDLIYA